MKSLFLPTALACCLFLTGCSDDDDDLFMFGQTATGVIDESNQGDIADAVLNNGLTFGDMQDYSINIAEMSLQSFSLSSDEDPAGQSIIDRSGECDGGSASLRLTSESQLTLVFSNCNVSQLGEDQVLYGPLTLHGTIAASEEITGNPDSMNASWTETLTITYSNLTVTMDNSTENYSLNGKISEEVSYNADTTETVTTLTGSNFSVATLDTSIFLTEAVQTGSEASDILYLELDYLIEVAGESGRYSAVTTSPLRSNGQNPYPTRGTMEISGLNEISIEMDFNTGNTETVSLTVDGDTFTGFCCGA